TILTADTSVQAGKYVYVALEGSILANGLEIKNREMRGLISEGMLCSLEELGLEEKSEHVYMTDGPLSLGEDVVKLLNLHDWFVDIQVTPNRPDCLSYFGVARELSAGLKRTPKFPVPKVQAEGADKVEVIIESEGCWRYTARVIRNVKIGPSPLWLQKRLIAFGLRPINNVVDITNYVMLETGHPVHAFDLKKLSGGLSGKIVVRDARPGERMLLLDGKTYEFSGNEVLITDGEKLLALAGIMGGEESGISTETTDVLLEVAMFDPVRIRKTARKLGLSTDSSYRFERGVDFDDAVFVVERLSELIQSICGGVPSVEIVDTHKKKLEQKVIYVPKNLTKKVLGIEIKHISEYIEPIGFEVEELKDGYNVYVPSFRYFDVSIPEDIMEEVGRIHGYDNLHGEPPRLLALERGRSLKQNLRYEIKQLMTSFGFNEANTLSFISSKSIEKLPINGSGLAVSNPIISEFDTMRPSILYGLLESLSYNYKRQ
ncbi:MAG: phenylalanine--tRNA ligase subunit beta, partial [Fervidobacterium sp.]